MRAEGRNKFCMKFLVDSLGLFTGNFLRTSAFFRGRKTYSSHIHVVHTSQQTGHHFIVLTKSVFGKNRLV